MNWFNYWGLAVVVIILLPNILYAVSKKGFFANTYNNRVVEILEQIGRYGSMFCMIFNIPYTYFNFWFDHALTVYLSVNGCLCIIYVISWIVFRNKQNRLGVLLLSGLPSAVFVFSGVMLVNIPLIVFSLLFSINHILFSWKNFISCPKSTDVNQ